MHILWKVMTVAHIEEKKHALGQQSLCKINLKYVKVVFSWKLEVIEPTSSP